MKKALRNSTMRNDITRAYHHWQVKRGFRYVMGEYFIEHKRIGKIQRSLVRNKGPFYKGAMLAVNNIDSFYVSDHALLQKLLARY